MSSVREMPQDSEIFVSVWGVASSLLTRVAIPTENKVSRISRQFVFFFSLSKIQSSLHLQVRENYHLCLQVREGYHLCLQVREIATHACRRLCTDRSKMHHVTLELSVF